MSVQFGGSKPASRKETVPRSEVQTEGEGACERTQFANEIGADKSSQAANGIYQPDRLGRRGFTQHGRGQLPETRHENCGARAKRAENLLPSRRRARDVPQMASDPPCQ